MGLVKSVVFVAVLGMLVWVGAMVPVGKRSFFGHVRAIWHSDEAKDMVEGVRDASGPMWERVQAGVRAGWQAAAAAEDAPIAPANDAGVGTADAPASGRAAVPSGNVVPTKDSAN